MIKQSSALSKLENTVSTLLLSRTRHDIVLFIILFVMLLSVTPLLAFWGVTAGIAVAIGLLVAPILAAAFVRWPIMGLYLIALCVFVVENEPLATPIGTDTLYVFYWPPQMAGFIERPIGIIILLTLFLWIFHHLVKRQPLLQGGALIGPFTLYILCVVGGVIYGLARGGDFKIITVEFRPFWYTFLSYILAYNFVTRKSHIRHFIWLVIVSAGVKGLQGLYVYLIAYHGNLSGHDTIMSHEESFFYASLLLLLVIFCLYYRYRPQLIASLCVAPPVLISLVANQRRADYIALVLGIVFAWVMVFLLKPKARRALLTGMIICCSVGVTYVLAGSTIPGAFGSPARSIIGIFDPSRGDSRDANSNLYRDYEDYDLKYTAKQNPLGLGFGREFLQPKPLTSVFPQIFSKDKYYNYVPHNTVYWIWVDLGPIGFFSLWFLIGSIIIRGCFIARQLKDPYLQVFAIFVIGVTVMEIAVAFADYQLYFYRNVIDMGLLAGLLVKLPLLDKEQQENITDESTDGMSVLSPSHVGNMYG
jgi:O-Antigen ligase